MKLELVFYYLIGFIAGLIFFVFPIIGWDFSFFPGDFADGRLNMFFLEHNYQYLSGKIDTYWDIPFMYPEQNVLAYSDNLMGSSPIYSFFRFIGLDTFSSYLWWMIFLTGLNYSAAFYSIKKILKNNQAALLGAFIFAFSLALQSQLAHAQTFPRFAIPLIFLCAYRFSETLNPKYFLFSILWLVYQIYCGIYLGFLSAIPLGIYFLLILFKDFRGENSWKSIRKWWLKMGVNLVSAVLILLPLMLPYLERRKDPSQEHFSEIVRSIPTFQSYLFPAVNSDFWDFLLPIGINMQNHWIHQIFPGVIALAGFVGGIIILFVQLKKVKFKISKLPQKYLLILVGLVTFLIFIRIGTYSIYQFFYYLPGFSSMRLLSRIINIELFFFGLSAGIVWMKYVSRNKELAKFVFPMLVVSLIIDNSFNGDNSVKRSISDAQKRVLLIDKSLKNLPKGAVFSFEPKTINSAIGYYHVDAMLIAQKHQLKTINAYTANCPKEYEKFWFNADETGRSEWLKSKENTTQKLFIIDENGLTKVQEASK